MSNLILNLCTLPVENEFTSLARDSYFEIGDRTRWVDVNHFHCNYLEFCTIEQFIEVA